MPTQLPAPSYRPDIQGLRAVAVLSVLGYHAGLPLFGGGYLGVDVFFVISGYLIGGHLLREVQTTGRLRFAAFYARRARRILPAALTVIAATVVAAWFFTPPLRLPGIATDGVWAALSAANIRFAIEGTDYLLGPTPSPLQHYWSLGVEEQFYVIVPLLLLALVAALRARPALLAAAGIVVTVASFAVCVAWGPTSAWTYFTLPARAWELGVGVLAAAAAASVAHLHQRWRVASAWVGAAGLLATAWVGALPAYPHPGVGTVLPVLATACVILGGQTAGESRDRRVPIVNQALGIRPAQFVGTLSFSLYLVHWPVLALAQENSNSETPLPLVARAALAVLSVPLAWLLWRLVERPALRTRVDAAHARRPLAVAALAVAALVVPLAVATPALAARPLASERVATGGAHKRPAGTGFVPSNLAPSLADAAADTGELYRSGCQQGTSESALKICSFGPDDGATVVLFGDSHAGRWFPALRAAFDNKPVRLMSLTKSGCRSLESESLWSGAENRSCAQWRASALDWLTRHPPRLLVLANHLGRSTGSAAAQQHWHDATVSTLTRLPRGVPVAIFGETPEFDFSPPICLSRHLNDALACSQSRATAVDGADLDGVRTGADELGAAFVDLTDWFCNPASCPTVIGSSLVYTDEHHLAATFSAQLGAPVFAELDPLIALGQGPS